MQTCRCQQELGCFPACGCMVCSIYHKHWVPGCQIVVGLERDDEGEQGSVHCVVLQAILESARPAAEEGKSWRL